MYTDSEIVIGAGILILFLWFGSAVFLGLLMRISEAIDDGKLKWVSLCVSLIGNPINWALEIPAFLIRAILNSWLIVLHFCLGDKWKDIDFWRRK